MKINKIPNLTANQRKELLKKYEREFKKIKTNQSFNYKEELKVKISNIKNIKTW